MTAIHRAPRSVSVSATALFIPFQRHPATLAILIRLIHNFERRLNLLALFLSSFAFQIIRDSGKLRDGRSKLAVAAVSDRRSCDRKPLTMPDICGVVAGEAGESFWSLDATRFFSECAIPSCCMFMAPSGRRAV